MALTIGPRLELYDAHSLRLAATSELPNTPEHFATDREGRRIALVFGGSDADGFEEQVLLFDAHSGKQLPGEARMAAPLKPVTLVQANWPTLGARPGLWPPPPVACMMPGCFHIPLSEYKDI